MIQLRLARLLPGVLLVLACCRGRQDPQAAVVPVSAAVAGNPVARFMQGMIAHHAQALEMAALVPRRSAHPALKLLAERITVSQRDEIALMRRWLQSRGHQPPGEQAQVHAAAGHGELMPGMLTQQQLARLEAAQGTGFDRLFLQSMIRHHEGALQMAGQLLAAERNLDAETFRFVSDIDADQRAEIGRMQSLLRSLP